MGLERVIDHRKEVFWQGENPFMQHLLWTRRERTPKLHLGWVRPYSVHHSLTRLSPAFIAETLTGLTQQTVSTRPSTLATENTRECLLCAVKTNNMQSRSRSHYCCTSFSWLGQQAVIILERRAEAACDRLSFDGLGGDG
ncbi:hypothetical protein PROFUN_00200 [Planoprotostelium fungivorum]|uniref:Uncharacterized protein n=1 Tax=Planoprotostelium fungivorum TaxID=1890364 RepID=A0A2P6P0Z1_9EUKA|nr:hypothetical protein PROFUN_00200 [Planoprotostelium fungivorum]